MGEDIFNPTIGNESLHQENNDNGVRIVNFATSINLVVKSKMLLHRNIHNYTTTSLDGLTHNANVYILMDSIWLSSALDVQSLRRADSHTDQYLVVAKFRER